MQVTPWQVGLEFCVSPLKYTQPTYLVVGVIMELGRIGAPSEESREQLSIPPPLQLLAPAAAAEPWSLDSEEWDR